MGLFSDLGKIEKTDFDFETIKVWLVNISVNDIEEVIENKDITKLGYLDVKRDTNGSTFFVLPNKQIINFNLESIHLHDKQDENVMEYITNPVMIDENGEPVLSGGEFLWEVSLKENYNSLTSISFGGTTKFYENFGWWPHIQVVDLENGNKIGKPLQFMGEALFEGRKGFMFASFHGQEDYPAKYEVISDDNIFEMESCFAFILEDNPVLPPWLSQKSLHPHSESICYLSSEVNNIEKRFVPIQKHYPKNATGSQGDYTLEAPFNNFFYQLPVIYYGIDEIQNGIFQINSGDLATFTICHNKKDEFRVAFQQT